MAEKTTAALIRALAEYVERYADQNDEPANGACRATLADARNFLATEGAPPARTQWDFTMTNGHDAIAFLFIADVDAKSYEDAIEQAREECVRQYPGTDSDDWHVEGDEDVACKSPAKSNAPVLADPNDMSADDRATLAAYYAQRREEEANFERGFRNAVRARNERGAR